jgi:hypothetical protein
MLRTENAAEPYAELVRLSGDRSIANDAIEHLGSDAHLAQKRQFKPARYPIWRGPRIEMRERGPKQSVSRPILVPIRQEPINQFSALGCHAERVQIRPQPAVQIQRFGSGYYVQLAAARKHQPGGGKQFDVGSKARSRAPDALGDYPDLAEAIRQQRQDPIRLTQIHATQHDCITSIDAISQTCGGG